MYGYCITMLSLKRDVDYSEHWPPHKLIDDGPCEGSTGQLSLYTETICHGNGLTTQRSTLGDMVIEHA